MLNNSANTFKLSPSPTAISRANVSAFSLVNVTTCAVTVPVPLQPKVPNVIPNNWFAKIPFVVAAKIFATLPD